jgi:hypothetical protein
MTKEQNRIANFVANLIFLKKKKEKTVTNFLNTYTYVLILLCIGLEKNVLFVFLFRKCATFYVVMYFLAIK